MIVAGTGHRPNKLGGYGEEATGKLVALARDWIRANKPERVVSGMALGWDQALAWAALDEGVPFTAAIPFEGQERAWPALSQQWYKDLLAKADKVVVVSEGGYAPWKMQVRNQWMVDNCDLVLALWDGSEGGTGNCIKYAEKTGREIENVWPVFNVKQEKDE